jgi:hypothetical protein
MMIEGSGAESGSIPLTSGIRIREALKHVDPDSDPGGPKTCGSGGPGFESGSGTLIKSHKEVTKQ